MDADEDADRGGDSDLCVLHVDDDPALVDLVGTYLEREVDGLGVRSVTDPEAALDALDDDVDCVVSDYVMPGMDGLELLEAVRADRPDLPFILFTGEGSEDIASEAVSAGVTDYLQKGTGTAQYEVLANRIVNAVEQSRAEERLRRQKRQYQALFEQAPVMYVVAHDEDGRPIVDDCNRRFLDRLGYDRDEVVGESVWEFYTEESVEAAVAGGGYDRALGGEFSTEERAFRTRDGEVVEVLDRAVPRYDDRGDIVGVLALYVDVTERKRYERELERYRELIENLPIGVYRNTPGPEGDWEFVNEAMLSLLGVDSREDLAERSVSDFYADPDRRAAFSETLSEQGAVEDYEIRVETPDDERKWASVTAVAVESGDDEVRFDSAIRDITERKEYERALERSNQRLQRVVEAVSRDLRSSVAAMRDAVEGTRGASPPVDDALDCTEALVDDLLALGRAGRPVESPGSVALSPAVRRAWDAADVDATLAADVDATLAADRERLDLALERLFRHVAARLDGDGAVRVGVDSDGFHVAVADAGDLTPEPGADPTASDGLDLAIVREVAAAHGWTLDVTAADGDVRFEFAGVERAG